MDGVYDETFAILKLFDMTGKLFTNVNKGGGDWVYGFMDNSGVHTDVPNWADGEPNDGDIGAYIDIETRKMYSLSYSERTSDQYILSCSSESLYSVGKRLMQ